MELSSVIGDIYDAGSGAGDWGQVGRKLFSALGAHAGTLRLKNAHSHAVNVFESTSEGEASYSQYYAHIDPLRAAISQVTPRGDWSSAVASVSDLVEEDHYLTSEFYQDFARPSGQNHMLMGAVGDQDHTVIGLFRDSRDFDGRDKSVLAALLPHIQRAIQLSHRLRDAELDARIGYAAFEAIQSSAMVVDESLNVLFANGAAERILARRGLPISIMAASHAGGGTRVALSKSDKMARFRALVEDAAFGGSGGAMRLEIDDDYSDRINQLAVFVSPQPPQFAMGDAKPGTPMPVLVMITELSRPSAPKPSLLSDLFGLSITERAVALALLGGQTAEAVARERDVSLETVRSQIRTVLRKTDATNLRDLERIGALLATLSH